MVVDSFKEVEEEIAEEEVPVVDLTGVELVAAAVVILKEEDEAEDEVAGNTKISTVLIIHKIIRAFSITKILK